MSSSAAWCWRQHAAGAGLRRLAPDHHPDAQVGTVLDCGWLVVSVAAKKEALVGASKDGGRG